MSFSRSLISLALAALIFSGKTSLAENRPFRAGLIKLNKALDRQAILGSSIPAGALVLGDLAIYPAEGNWLGARSLVTGNQQWFYGLDADITTPLALVGQSVLVATRTGKVSRVDTVTGKREWEVELDAFASRPIAILGSTAIVVTAAQTIHALDLQSGKRIWIHDAGFPESLTVKTAAPAAFFEGKVLVGLSGGEVLALEQDTGKVAWKLLPGFLEGRFHDIIGQIGVSQGRLYLSRYDGLVGSFDLTRLDRSQVWRLDTSPASTSLFSGNRFYIGSVNGDVSAVEPVSGRLLWKKSFYHSINSFTHAEGVIYLAGSNGLVAALNPNDGQTIWQDHLASDISSAPAFFKDMVYFMTSLANLYFYKVQRLGS